MGLISTNANNHCGHGFYQFSPELFFRVFQPQNGFEICNAIMVQHPFPGAELSAAQRFYEVVDPDSVKCRVGLVSASPMLIMILAKRIADCPIFASPPQQSDYQKKWDAHSDSNEQLVEPVPPATTPIARLRRMAGNTKRAIQRASPPKIQQRLNGWGQLREYSLSNKKFYRQWKP